MNIWNELFEPYQDYLLADIMVETLAVIFGLLSVWYARKEHILVYPTGIISTALYVYLLYKFGLFGDMTINAYYFSMSIYGWYRWTRPEGESKFLPISRASTKQHLIGLLVLMVSFGLLYYILNNFTSSTVPLVDSFTTAIFFVGMWFMANKKIENWWYWILGDLISVPLYYYKGLTLSSIQFLIFLLIAIAGLIHWERKLREFKISNDAG